MPTPSRPAPARTSWIVAAAATAYWVLALAVLRLGAPDPRDDLWEYGVAARHLLAGDGFRTSAIHPPLWGLRDASDTVPLLVHGPLLPALVAPLLLLLGSGALEHLAWLGAVFATLAAFCVHRVAARRGGGRIAAATAMIFTGAPLLLTAVRHDLAMAAGALFFALALDLLLRDEPRDLAAGFALGLGSLVRPEMTLVAVLLPLAAAGSFRWGRYAAGFLACALPWAWHQYRTSGLPFFNLSHYLLVSYWGAYPELSALRDFELVPARWPQVLAEHSAELWRKWLFHAPRAVKHGLTASGAGTGVLAAAGFARLAVGRRQEAWGRAAVVAVIPLGLIVATEHSPRYLVPFLPLWALAAAYGADALARIAWRGRPPGRVWLAGIAVLVLLSTVPAWIAARREAVRLEAVLARERHDLAARGISSGSRAGVVFTDYADFVAWQARRPAVWLMRAEYERLPMRPQVGRFVPARADDRDTWFHPAPLAPGGRASESRDPRPPAPAGP